ncbi:tetratricopeptide repeat protein [Prochlorococcus marinus]|uniref:tetratricopeptide repeat protein n=1 Tax=Prochlorococcus marinus TaxID=1219 RepID=UPI003D27C64A
MNESIGGANEILGIVFQSQSNPDKAIECYQKELNVNPQASNSLLNVGLLLLQKGGYSESNFNNSRIYAMR